MRRDRDSIDPPAPPTPLDLVISFGKKFPRQTHPPGAQPVQKIWITGSLAVDFPGRRCGAAVHTEAPAGAQAAAHGLCLVVAHRAHHLVVGIHEGSHEHLLLRRLGAPANPRPTPANSAPTPPKSMLRALPSAAASWTPERLSIMVRTVAASLNWKLPAIAPAKGESAPTTPRNPPVSCLLKVTGGIRV